MRQTKHVHFIGIRIADTYDAITTSLHQNSRRQLFNKELKREAKGSRRSGITGKDMMNRSMEKFFFVRIAS